MLVNALPTASAPAFAVASHAIIRAAPPLSAAAAAAAPAGGAQLLASTTTTLSAAAAASSCGTSFVPAAAASAAAALVLRGGAKAAAFDLTRARVRLEGLSNYGVITTLLMNASLRLFSGTPKKIKDENESKDARVENVVTVIFSFFSMLSVLTGIYTSIVFGLLGLYSKTALGMGNDAAYLEFFTATAHLRETGFHSLIYSLITFKASYVCSLFLNYKGMLRWILSGSGAFVSIVSWLKWKTIMRIASDVLFHKSW